MKKNTESHISKTFGVLNSIGMTGLEPATSTSLMWRSSQTEPHPDIL